MAFGSKRASWMRHAGLVVQFVRVKNHWFLRDIEPNGQTELWSLPVKTKMVEHNVKRNMHLGREEGIHLQQYFAVTNFKCLWRILFCPFKLLQINFSSYLFHLSSCFSQQSICRRNDARWHCRCHCAAVSGSHEQYDLRQMAQADRSVLNKSYNVNPLTYN